jgi:hypothetical protein
MTNKTEEMARIEAANYIGQWQNLTDIRQPTTPPPIVRIENPDTGRHLLSIHPDGTVTGEIEDASEAARMFVKGLRGYLPRPSIRDTLTDAKRSCLQLIANAPNGRIGSNSPELLDFESVGATIGALEYAIDVGWVYEVACVGDGDENELLLSQSGYETLRQSTRSPDYLEGYNAGLHDLKALNADNALRQPTQSDAQRNTPIWTEAATIQTNGRWKGKTARSDALPMDTALISAYKQGFADGTEDQRDCEPGETPHKDCISEGFQNWLANNPSIRAALQEQSNG